MGGQPETPIYCQGRRYFTNCFNSNPTNGTSIAFVFLDRDGIAVPVAALGRANDWPLLKEDAFRPCWPQSADLQGDYWRNQSLFAWSDQNADGHVQPDEVAMQSGSGGGRPMPRKPSVAIAKMA